jgi:hypothetical protein
MKSKIVIPILVSCGVIITIIFGSYAIALDVAYKNTYLSNNECGNWTMSNPISSLSQSNEIEKSFAIWQWSYNCQRPDSCEIRQQCGSWNHDACLRIDNQIVYCTDRKTFSLSRLDLIRDCHGNIQYQIQTATTFDSLINVNGVYVSWLLQDVNQNTIAYVTSTDYFFSTQVSYIDAETGQELVSLAKDVSSSRWTWTATINNETSAYLIPLVLLSAAQYSFSQGSFLSTSNNSTDGCNQFLLAAIIIAASALAFLVIAGIYFIYLFVKKLRANNAFRPASASMYLPSL